MASFLWYDLETFGTDPRRSRIAQFAGIRTTTDLEPVGEPVELFCRPADDLLPSPQAVLVTGITPQQALARGEPEATFMARVNEVLSEPGTCAVGYNSLRFDDEFVRHGLFRTFHDPYEREWRNGNSRWDLLDHMRLMHALRPDGLSWPRREDGHTSFRLEHLTAANGIEHGRAHDAMADVEALIALARKARDAQPRLWDYYLRLRDKRAAARVVDVANQVPLLHVSGRYPASRHCAALVLPITRHPAIDSRVVCFDLDCDPHDLLHLSARDIAQRLYTPLDELPEGAARVPLKEIHLNKVPALVPLEHLREADYQRLGIDLAACLANAEAIRRSDGLSEKVRRVFESNAFPPAGDVDASLYDGFLPDADRRQFPALRATPPSQLRTAGFRFQDRRLDELLFRYRARNWPDTLSDAERRRWDDTRRARLVDDDGSAELGFTAYFELIGTLSADPGTRPEQRALLQALEDWGRGLRATLPS